MINILEQKMAFDLNNTATIQVHAAKLRCAYVVEILNTKSNTSWIPVLIFGVVVLYFLGMITSALFPGFINPPRPPYNNPDE